jgi:hypothetical protein
MAGSFLENDLPVFFASPDFGEASGTVTWKGAAVQVIFDDEDIEVPNGEGVATLLHQPMITGNSGDFIGIADGDAVVANGTNYTVSEWKDDGTGVIEIFLKAV